MVPSFSVLTMRSTRGDERFVRDFADRTDWPLEIAKHSTKLAATGANNRERRTRFFSSDRKSRFDFFSLLSIFLSFLD
jgi:hypothetical protein